MSLIYLTHSSNISYIFSLNKTKNKDKSITLDKVNLLRHTRQGSNPTALNKFTNNGSNRDWLSNYMRLSQDKAQVQDWDPKQTREP
jgi:hypothetical protein